MHRTIFSRYVLPILMMAALCLAGLAQPADVQSQVKKESNGKDLKATSAPTSAMEELVPLDIKRPSQQYRRENSYWDLKPVSPFMVPRGITLLSRNKLVTASVEPCEGELQQITDGEKTHRYASTVVRMGLGVQWVQIDLGEACDIYAIAIWHNFRDRPYVFRDVVIRCADDPDFKKNVRTFFNNDRDNSAQLGQGMDLEYVDTWQGKIIDGKDARGKPARTRYIRCYSNGKNNHDGYNDYTEIEIFGRSAGAQVQSENTPSSTALKATGTQTSATEELVQLEIKKPRQKVRPGITFVTVDELYANPRPPLMVPREVRLLSLNKKVTASAEPMVGDLTLVTDGDKEDADGFFLELDKFGVQWVQVDLEESYEVFAVVIWHRFFDRPVYHDVIVQCADDQDFKTNVKTLFNNDSDNSAKLGKGVDSEYIDTWQGKLIAGRDRQGKPVRARYIRCYSNGSTVDVLNCYLEVEVYGRPCAQPEQ